MPEYRGITLIKVEEKTGGKNRNPVDGFYTGHDVNGDKVHYFIKQPADPKELFTELLAGRLLQRFIQHGLIDPRYHTSLVCADSIQLEDGTYALIQPMIKNITPLHRIIGTSTSDGSDRSAAYESMFGLYSYRILLERLPSHYGLSTILMLSLLLGDYSVHSGNIMCQTTNETTQFFRIDWGAAFRYFGNPQNHQDILVPYEYRGTGWLKVLTKNYIANYKDIPGLYPDIAKKAAELSNQINPELLKKIVSEALKEIPLNLLTTQDKIALADYLELESFGKSDEEYLFITQFTEVLLTRLEKITALQEQSAAPSRDGLRYKSNVGVRDIPPEEPDDDYGVVASQSSPTELAETQRQLDEQRRLEQESKRAELLQQQSDIQMQETQSRQQQEEAAFQSLERIGFEIIESSTRQHLVEKAELERQRARREQQLLEAQHLEAETRRTSQAQLRLAENQRIANEVRAHNNHQAAPIVTRLLELTNSYHQHLSKIPNNNTKLEHVTHLKAILEAPEKDNTSKLAEFYTSLDNVSAILKDHRDASWKRFIRAALIIGAICITGILPGITALGIYQYLHPQISFWKPQGKVYSKCVENHRSANFLAVP